MYTLLVKMVGYAEGAIMMPEQNNDYIIHYRCPPLRGHPSGIK